MRKSTTCWCSGIVLTLLVAGLIALHVMYVLDKKYQRELMAAMQNSSKCFYSTDEQIMLNQNALVSVVSTQPDSTVAAHMNAFIVYDSIPGNRTSITGKVIVPIELNDIELEVLPKSGEEFVFLHSRCAGLKLHIKPLLSSPNNGSTPPQPAATASTAYNTDLMMAEPTITGNGTTKIEEVSTEPSVDKRRYLASIRLFNFVPKDHKAPTTIWACKAELGESDVVFEASRVCVRNRHFRCSRQVSRVSTKEVATLYVHSLAVELSRKNSAYTPTNSFENLDIEQCVHSIGDEVFGTPLKQLSVS